MAYDIALNKAWEELAKAAGNSKLSVKFLADEYEVDLENKKVTSEACNVPAKDFSAILILHYLARKALNLPELTGEWVSFKELSGIEGYYPAFRKRSLEPLLRKYGRSPSGLLSALDRIPGKRVQEGDISLVIEAFDQVPVMVILWKGDQEFGPEAGMLFDRSVSRIFCVEDIVVLAGIVAASL